MTKKQEAERIYNRNLLCTLDEDLNGEVKIKHKNYKAVGFDSTFNCPKDAMIYGADGYAWGFSHSFSGYEKRIFIRELQEMLEYKQTIRPKDVYGSQYDGYSVGSTLSEYFNNSQEKVKILAFRPPVTGEYFISTGWKIEMASGSIKWYDPRLIVEFVKNKKYVFTEDKNGSYIKTTDGTFVNASCHTGTKYRLDVVEE